MALFIQRARQIKTDLRIGAEELAWAARICKLVEGNPLAIELAAPWVQVLSLREIVEELERHLDILESSAHDLPARHHSIRTTFNYSWNLLSEDERLTLSRLSVFRGSFTRKAVEKITGTSLSQLFLVKAKSWLLRDTSGRFSLHELVHQYAAEKLQIDPEEELQTHVHFSDYYANFMEKWEYKIKSPNSVDTLAEMSNEIDKMRQAWDWMILREQPANISRSRFSLFCFHELHGLHRQGITLFDNAISMLRVLYENDKGQKTAVETL